MTATSTQAAALRDNGEGGRDARPLSPVRKRPVNWRMGLEIAVFVLPALVLFFMFVVWPMLRAVQFSVYRWKGFGPLTDFVGLRNYVSVLTNDVFLGALGHNLFIVVASIAIQLPLGIAVALLLNRKMKFQGLLRTIVFVPYILAEVIAPIATEIAAATKPGGTVLASGIIRARQQMIEEAFAAVGLVVMRVEYQGEWVLIEARKPDMAIEARD